MLQRNAVARVRVLLSLSLTLGVLSFGAPSAQAGYWYIDSVWDYGGFPVNAGETYSPGWVSNVALGNRVWYGGAGNITVCQRTFDHTSGVYREGCGVNSVGNSTNLTPYQGHEMEPKLKNASPWLHTINAQFWRGWWVN